MLSLCRLWSVSGPPIVEKGGERGEWREDSGERTEERGERREERGQWRDEIESEVD